jgi:phosphomannomutase
VLVEILQGLPVKCVPTGVKHLHHAAERYDIGVYFEANGHGTILFSPETIDIFTKFEPSTPGQDAAVVQLQALVNLINQAVGDAISDFLLVEVILAHKRWTAEEWDAGYEDLPNRLLKVNVPDRNAFMTEDAERRLTSPAGMQAELDDLVHKFDKGRSFVRPSGTEDCVRVYAEGGTESGAIRKLHLSLCNTWLMSSALTQNLGRLSKNSSKGLPVPCESVNGNSVVVFVTRAKLGCFGMSDKRRSSICDLVTVEKTAM